MATVMTGDLLDVSGGIICHQVNCFARMGAGLAQQISRRWPIVNKKYNRLCRDTNPPTALLGHVQFVTVCTSDNDSLVVANLFGQMSYGFDGGVYTYTDAHRKAWPVIRNLAKLLDLPVFAPWKIGCGLGGGNWEEIKAVIEHAIPNIIWVRKVG